MVLEPRMAPDQVALMYEAGARVVLNELIRYLRDAPHQLSVVHQDLIGS